MRIEENKLHGTYYTQSKTEKKRKRYAALTIYKYLLEAELLKSVRRPSY